MTKRHTFSIVAYIAIGLIIGTPFTRGLPIAPSDHLDEWELLPTISHQDLLTPDGVKLVAPWDNLELQCYAKIESSKLLVHNKGDQQVAANFKVHGETYEVFLNSGQEVTVKRNMPEHSDATAIKGYVKSVEQMLEELQYPH